MTYEQVLAILAPVLLALLSALGTLAVYYVKLLTTRIKNDIEAMEDEQAAKIARRVINDAESLILTAIEEVHQTYTMDIKAASEDGKLTKEEATEALNRAVNRVMDLMPDEMYESLQSLFPDVEEWIIAKIQSFLYKSKKRLQSF